ncbi:unnamed protein product [Camellia sinensis]
MIFERPKLDPPWTERPKLDLRLWVFGSTVLRLGCFDFVLIFFFFDFFGDFANCDFVLRLDFFCDFFFFVCADFDLRLNHYVFDLFFFLFGFEERERERAMWLFNKPRRFFQAT